MVLRASEQVFSKNAENVQLLVACHLEAHVFVDIARDTPVGRAATPRRPSHS
jgi:hypothetical protein